MEQKSNNTSGMCEAEQRIALATVIAYQLGKDLNPQQLSQLITFINVINAQLALLASAKQAELSTSPQKALLESEQFDLDDTAISTDAISDL